MDKYGKNYNNSKNVLMRKYIRIRAEQQWKIYLIRKQQVITAFTDSGFKHFTSVHDSLAFELSWY